MMYNAPPPNLIKGIGLVQAGRKHDALQYLRHAAQTESFTPDAWLWLAAATDNLDEYRHCVYQALHLDPYHPVAGRMRRALEAHDTNARQPQPTPAYMRPVQQAPAYGSSPYGPSEGYPVVRQERVRRRASRLRRIVRALVLALLIGGCLGVSAAPIVSGQVTNLVRDWLRIEDLHTLDFTVGETPGYHFRVELPDSWEPANEDNDSWRSTRGELQAAFSQNAALWELLDSHFSVAVSDPVYGTVMPLVRLVETDTVRIEADGIVAVLTLHEIVQLPEPLEGQPDAVCDRMRALETQMTASSDGSLVGTGIEVLDASLVVRDDLDDCVFTVSRRYTGQRADQVPTALEAANIPSATREVTVAVPVGADYVAVWRMVYADSAQNVYDTAVSRVIKTLVYLP